MKKTAIYVKLFGKKQEYQMKHAITIKQLIKSVMLLTNVVHVLKLVHVEE